MRANKIQLQPEKNAAAQAGLMKSANCTKIQEKIISGFISRIK